MTIHFLDILEKKSGFFFSQKCLYFKNVWIFKKNLQNESFNVFETHHPNLKAWQQEIHFGSSLKDLKLDPENYRKFSIFFSHKNAYNSEIYEHRPTAAAVAAPIFPKKTQKDFRDVACEEVYIRQEQFAKITFFKVIFTFFKTFFKVNTFSELFIESPGQ